MSRAMKPEEEAFEKKHGCKPTRISVALDCLAVFVHKDHPVKSLTMEQIDCLFSKEGQEIVVKDGYAPLPASLIAKQLKALQ
jgi:ABC-type phosphate transport system substrate-binding protein